jgi:hypothetical protein
MGSAELDLIHDKLTIYSHIVTYGNSASAQLTDQIREEIEFMWNEPMGMVSYKQKELLVEFVITAEYKPSLTQQEILENADPRNNYFRIEKYSNLHISFVDGNKSNTGYFLLENLYPGSTTAAHEYGHTLGLDHPPTIDWRGKGAPRIMFARGTIVNPEFQYNPAGRPGDGNNGGTMHPKYRKVYPEDIYDLKLHKLDFEDNKAIVGAFSSIWHPDHSVVAGAD